MEYKIIKGFENYGIYENGDIINVKTNRILKKSKDNLGYYKVILYNDDNKKTFRIHRLLGEYYLDKIEGKNIIDHKDGDKENNDLSNLRWCNHSENNRNIKKKSNNKYFGVIYDKNNKKWITRIRLNGTRICIGSGDCEDSVYKMRVEYLTNHNLLDFFKI